MKHFIGILVINKFHLLNKVIERLVIIIQYIGKGYTINIFALCIEIKTNSLEYLIVKFEYYYFYYYRGVYYLC